ncbi:DotU family type IV/VI secretion system protein [Thalassoroseus pseudoceratinae]|uniref:DotU family type IV/VI secretion system protein n=1 Tax=Thalassoroseus pseudoceratinae TaxID=2713176 RepID=UPI0014219E39|nr:DotU family type IV/VI secretion system protein [Thalassoroseus pseudoceratinae]
MTPRFALAVDPIFQRVLTLLDQIAQGRTLDPSTEQHAIRKLMERGEAIVGCCREWDLTRYALVSWIDEMLVDTPWNGADWWNDNILEITLFNSRLSSEQFFHYAAEASEMPQRNAYEVFYNCVLLGFRGFYRSGELDREFSRSMSYPPDLESWLRQAAIGLRLRDDRPELGPLERTLPGAAPLTGRKQFVWSVLLVLMLGIVNIAGYHLWYQP